MQSYSSYSVSEDSGDSAEPGDDAAHDLFVTETMAELSARQGRLADAAAIYRRLLAAGGAGDKRASWEARLAALEGTGSGGAIVRVSVGSTLVRAPARVAAAPSRPPASPPGAPAPPVPVVAPAPMAAPRMSLLVREPVRSGQIIYAEGRDLIVLAPVNPGAQLMADGHIHIYAPLRGRAVAGVRGAADAQIFCQRLEAELVGIDAAYVPADDLPPDLVGKAVRIWLEAGACRFARI